MSADANILSSISLADLISHKGMNVANKLYDKHSKKNALRTKNIHQLRSYLPTLLDHYEPQLARTNPAMFDFMGKEQRIALLNQLKLTYYLLYADHQLDEAEGRKQNFKGQVANIRRCGELIDRLDLLVYPTKTVKSPQVKHDIAMAESEKYLKFCGMTIVAPVIVQKIMELISGITVKTKQLMTDVNIHRLYWVWTSSMLMATLDMLPDDFFNTPQAKTGVAAPSPITGYMSWILYYARFGINLGLLLKHTINGPWMSEEESKIPAWERFTTQWQQRKFSLLNDSIWATVNMACFFWLKGAGTLGYIGGIVTAALLLMDLTLTVWRFWEESTAHNKTMLELEKAQKNLSNSIAEEKESRDKNEQENAKINLQLISLEEKIRELEHKKDKEKDENEQIISLGKELLALKRKLEKSQNVITAATDTIVALDNKILENKKLIKKTEFDWKYKKYSNINDLVYAAGLLFAFCLMVCFFCPPAMLAPATALILGLAGAAVCFVLTLAYSAVTGAIEIAKTKESSRLAKEECQQLLDAFNACTDENTRKMLFLEMKGLMAESEYQERMMRFQIIKLVRSILIDAFVPFIIFTSLVFMPLGIGLGVMAAGLALAILSKILINRFEPKADELPTFDDKIEAEYNAFNNNSERCLADLEKKTAKSAGFFTSKSQQDDYIPLKEDVDEENDGFGVDSSSI